MTTTTTDRRSDDPATRAQPDIASFVLRFSQDVWREADGEPHVRWRGHIRHVQSDAETRFTDFADALAFIQSRLAQLTLDSVAGDSAEHQAQAMSDSLRLWERFTADYTDLVVRSMQQSLRQTQAYQRQVGESLTRSLTLWSPLLAAGFPTAAAPSAGHPAASPPPAPTIAPPDSPATAPTASLAESAPATDPALLEVIAALVAQVADLARQVERLESAIRPDHEGGVAGGERPR